MGGVSWETGGQRVEICGTPVPSLLTFPHTAYPGCSEERCRERDRWEDSSGKDRNWLGEIPAEGLEVALQGMRGEERGKGLGSYSQEKRNQQAESPPI